MQSEQRPLSSPTGSAPAPHPADLPAELAACCLLKLNRAAEAEVLLRKEGDRGGGWDYYLGVALAHQGKTDEALRCLQEASRQPTNGKAAQHALLALLKRQAQQRIARRDWDGAAVALSQALDVDPANPELRQMLSVLGNHLPVIYLKACRRDEAAAAWEKAQKGDPGNFGIAHSLGLLYFWWAQELEAQRKGREAVAAWEGAIRNWVVLSYGNSYWTHWKEERERACGPIPDSAVEGLRRKLTEQLDRKIADYQNDYLTQKHAADARRLSMLSLELAAEVRTAEALKRVGESLRRQGKEADLPPLCGVLMLKHLGQLEVAQRLLALVEVTQTNEASTEQLHWCLSPWVFPWIMVQEHRYEEAIDHLEKCLRDSPSQDGHDLLAIASLERGNLLAKAGEVGRALEVWKDGLAHVRARKKTGDQIIQQAEKAAIKEATRLQREEGQDGLEKAIQLLEKAMNVADTRRVKENLSELYTSLGVKEGNDQSQSESRRIAKAKKNLERALQLNPNNGRAKENLAIVLAGEAIDLFNRDRYTDAIALLRRAHQLAPGNSHIRQNFSRALSSYGVHRWNQGNHTEGDNLIREALEVDPSNEHARKNLPGGGGPGASDIDSILRMIRKKNR
jgi:tetratricopeptide (TPR) repeat protein